MSEIDYEKDVKIDASALDVEWINQASLAWRYAKNAAYWNDQVRTLEEKKKTIRSRLIIQVNEDPKTLLGKDKPNSGDIEAYYRMDPEYQAAVRELNEALKEAEYADQAKNEICFTRKKALEYLVILHGQQYFAGPSVPRDLSYEQQKRESQRQSDAKIRIGKSDQKETTENKPMKRRRK